MKTFRFPDIKRVALLLRNTLFLKRHAIIVVGSALIGIITIISAMDAATGLRPGFYQASFLLVLYSSGMLVTGRSFRDVHDPVQGPAFLLTPASNLEKLISRLAQTTVVHILMMMLLYMILSLISEGLNQFVFGAHHPLFNPFDLNILVGCAVYMVIQAPFLLGAIYFKKHALSKTVLSMCLYIIMLVVVCLLGLKLFFGGFLDGFAPALELINRIQDISFTHIAVLFEQFATYGKSALGIIFWGLIGPLCWVIAYFRLKETEA